MGESIGEALINEDKMGEVGPRNPVLEVSVSFGRFESDSLSWEKWSSFSPNKYLEEVEKCATPGSVAEKKAYFEEHYKKIAARKAELMDQEKLMESKSFKSDDLDQNGGDLCGESNVQCSVEEVKKEGSEVTGIHDDVPNEAATAAECQSSSTEGEGEVEEKNCGMENAKPCEAAEETAPVEADLEKEEELACVNSEDKKEITNNRDEEKTPKIKEENTKLDHRAKSNKISTPVKNAKKVTEVKMKSVSPRNKNLQSCTPQTAKTASTSTTMPSSRTSTKGGTLSSLKRTENSSMRDSDKVATRSLHTSLNLDPSGSNSAPPAATRKYTIKTSAKEGAVSSSTRTKNPSMQDSKKEAPRSLHMSLNLDASGSNSAPLATTRKSTIETSAKKGNMSSSTRTKKPSTRESKKEAPRSLHMSLNLDSLGSNSASPATTKKSTISAKEGTVSSSTRTKNPSMRERSKEAPRSLHMSLNLDPAVSNSAPATTRKSAIKPSAKEGTVSSLISTKNPSTQKSKKEAPRSLHMSLNLDPSGSNSTPLATTTKPFTLTSTKGGTVTLSTRTKDSSIRGSKKVDPKSLHMSLNLDPSESNPAPPATTRKSLIMEKMGDKDIVKRAFKTFRDKFNQLRSSRQEKSTTPKEIFEKVTEPKDSTSKTPRRENRGSVRTDRMEKNTAKDALPQVALKNDENAEKRKEVSKKLEEKSHARDAERTQLRTKPKINRPNFLCLVKDDKEAEIKRLRESFSFKATPLPAFYHRQKLSNSQLDKDAKKQNH